MEKERGSESGTKEHSSGGYASKYNYSRYNYTTLAPQIVPEKKRKSPDGKREDL